MPRVLDPFRFVPIAVAGWMNQPQLQIIPPVTTQNRSARGSVFSTRFIRRERGSWASVVICEPSECGGGRVMPALDLAVA